MNHPLEKRHQTCEAELTAALASIEKTRETLAEARRPSRAGPPSRRRPRRARGTTPPSGGRAGRSSAPRRTSANWGTAMPSWPGRSSARITP